MRRKMYATAMTAMLVTGTLMGLAVPAEERDGVTLHGDSTYDSIEKITDEDLTLKIMLAIRDGDTIKAPEELAAVQDLEALTGVNIEWEVIKASDWSMKTNLMFASGEMPDIIIAVNGQGQIDYEEYGVSQELVIPLDDYITEELMPNYYSRIQAEESDPTISLVASDGKTYSIGYLVGQYICEEGHYFINRDWMNELGLEDPTTIEELTEVLRKFKEAYPDYVPYEMGLDAGAYYDKKYVLPIFGIPNSDKWHSLYLYTTHCLYSSHMAEESKHHRCFDPNPMGYLSRYVNSNVMADTVSIHQPYQFRS